jgi:hypothetical protein
VLTLRRAAAPEVEAGKSAGMPGACSRDFPEVESHPGPESALDLVNEQQTITTGA